MHRIGGQGGGDGGQEYGHQTIISSIFASGHENDWFFLKVLEGGGQGGGDGRKGSGYSSPDDVKSLKNNLK